MLIGVWCFYQLLFWRHPFTPEDPLVNKWCISPNLMNVWLENGHSGLIFMLGWTTPLSQCQFNNVSFLWFIGWAFQPSDWPKTVTRDEFEGSDQTFVALLADRLLQEHFASTLLMTPKAFRSWRLAKPHVINKAFYGEYWKWPECLALFLTQNKTF